MRSSAALVNAPVHTRWTLCSLHAWPVPVRDLCHLPQSVTLKVGCVSHTLCRHWSAPVLLVSQHFFVHDLNGFARQRSQVSGRQSAVSECQTAVPVNLCRQHESQCGSLPACHCSRSQRLESPLAWALQGLQESQAVSAMLQHVATIFCGWVINSPV